MTQQGAAEVVTVALADLVQSAEFQVRRRLDSGTIEKYAQAYRAGVAFPALEVALVDGAAVLVDGWHRVQALKSIGRWEAEARVTTATRQDALWMAARANLTHGLPLKSRELRTVFQAYVRAKQHRRSDGQLKSYREIGTEIGRHNTTIREWMMKDFPKLARQFASDDQSGTKGGLRETRKRTFADDVREHLTAAVAAARGVTSGEERTRLIALCEETLQALKVGGPWNPEDADF